MEIISSPCTAPEALTVETVRTWGLELTDVERRIGARFARRETHKQAGASIRGLLSPVERKNEWQLAEVAGDETPYGVQHL